MLLFIVDHLTNKIKHTFWFSEHAQFKHIKHKTHIKWVISIQAAAVVRAVQTATVNHTDIFRRLDLFTAKGLHSFYFVGFCLDQMSRSNSFIFIFISNALSLSICRLLSSFRQYNIILIDGRSVFIRKVLKSHYTIFSKEKSIHFVVLC